MKSRRKYSDVFDALKEEIVGGKYCAGSVFPSHAMIARRFGISNLTAVKVVEKLKNAGLVCSQQGRGTFVTRQGASRKIGILVPGSKRVRDKRYSLERYSQVASEGRRPDCIRAFMATLPR